MDPTATGTLHLIENINYREEFKLHPMYIFEISSKSFPSIHSPTNGPPLSRTAIRSSLSTP